MISFGGMRKMAEKNSESRTGARALDRIDQMLLAALQAAGRMRLEDLARQVELAPSSVHDRLRRLERDGVIRRWTIDLDAAQLGLGVLAYIGVSSAGNCSVLVEDLLTIPEIEEAHSVAGELCMMLKVRVPDTNALLGLIERLRQLDGVKSTHTTVVLKTQIDRPI